MEFIDLKTQYNKYKKEIDNAIHEVLDSSQYVMGPEVGQVESQLAEFVGVKHCITASSGTDTLLMSMMALDIGPGDEVITTPFTFVSTVETISFLGAKPVFTDIELDTYNIDPALIEAAITPKTKAIMPVGLFGHMPDLFAINAIAEKYGIPVIEDAAQSFGATLDGKKSCGMTTIGSTSFFPAKPLGCYGDGGAIFTDRDDLASELRAIRVHGGAARHQYTRIGLNGRFDTIQAAVIKTKLPHFPDEIRKRRAIGTRYNELLQDVCQTPQIRENYTSTFAIYTIRIPERDRVASLLKDKGIPTSIYYPTPIYAQPAYKNLGISPGAFPVTEQACKEVLSLPMHPWLTEEAQDFIAEAVKESATAGALS